MNQKGITDQPSVDTEKEADCYLMFPQQAKDLLWTLTRSSDSKAPYAVQLLNEVMEQPHCRDTKSPEPRRKWPTKKALLIKINYLQRELNCSRAGRTSEKHDYDVLTYNQEQLIKQQSSEIAKLKNTNRQHLETIMKLQTAPGTAALLKNELDGIRATLVMVQQERDRAVKIRNKAEKDRDHHSRHAGKLINMNMDLNDEVQKLRSQILTDLERDQIKLMSKVSTLENTG